MRKVTEWVSKSVEPWEKAGVRPDQLLIQPLLGGLSNVLHSVEITDAALTRRVMRANGPAKLLVRTFEASPTLVKPEQEQIIFEACGKTGLSPRMWAVDRDGKGLRAEEFLDGDTMSLEQLRMLDVQLRQAPVIARLHCVQARRCAGVPLSCAAADAVEVVQVPLDDSRPWIKHKTQSWLKAAMDVVPKLGGNRAAAFRKLEGMGSLRDQVCVSQVHTARCCSWLMWRCAQVMWYTDELLPRLEKLYGAKALGGIGTPGVDQPLDVVFCHNDLQEGNWLIQDDDEMRVGGTRVCVCVVGCVVINARCWSQVIDYEYGGYNYRCTWTCLFIALRRHG